MTDYDVIPTPAGPVTVEMRDGMVTRLHLGSRRLRGARRRKLPQARQWVAAWFKGGEDRVPLKLQGTDFTQRVYHVVRSIPAGETLSYGDVAQAAGRPGAARAVGNVMARNRICLFIPCHRVVASNGIGGFAGDGGVAQKKLLLQLEGAI